MNIMNFKDNFNKQLNKIQYVVVITVMVRAMILKKIKKLLN